MNLVIHEDACHFLSQFRQIAPESVALAYLDPPFNVGSDFSARLEPKQARGRKTRQSGPTAYSDSWGGIDGFLDFLEPVLASLRECLAPRSSVWLHLDYRTVHEAKVLCDKVFGRNAFRGEVIWVPGNGARRKQGPSVTHQTLLVYVRDGRSETEMIWNADSPCAREPFAETSLRMHFKNQDESGRYYRERTLHGKTYRYYADEGRRRGSVWTDIPAMIANTPIRKEGTGYPTQKPEALLERIVELASRAGDCVCDPMCGSGTTLAVAGRLGRRFVGSDASPLAFEIASQRLRADGLEFETQIVIPT